MATGYELNVLGIEFRSVPNSQHPVQIGREAHPSSYTICTGSCSGLEWPGSDFNLQLLSNAEVKERVNLHFHAPYGNA